ncbi:MAG: hypothetical protein AAF998_18125 [Bacteroidota bacterium]
MIGRFLPSGSWLILFLHPDVDVPEESDQDEFINTPEKVHALKKFIQLARRQFKELLAF